MTLVLIALWIAGHSFEWYWLIATVLFDIVWMALKLNFVAVLMRRAVEEAAISIIEEVNKNAPPASPPEA